LLSQHFIRRRIKGSENVGLDWHQDRLWEITQSLPIFLYFFSLSYLFIDIKLWSKRWFNFKTNMNFCFSSTLHKSSITIHRIDDSFSSLIFNSAVNKVKKLQINQLDAWQSIMTLILMTLIIMDADKSICRRFKLEVRS